MAIIKNRVTVYKEQAQHLENQKAEINTRLMVRVPCPAW
jgi:hypothetical protein